MYHYTMKKILNILTAKTYATFHLCLLWVEVIQSQPESHRYTEESVNTVVWPEADLKFLYSILRGQSKPKVNFWKFQSRGFTRSIKLTIELPQHSDDELPQRLQRTKTSTRSIITSASRTQ